MSISALVAVPAAAVAQTERSRRVRAVVTVALVLCVLCLPWLVPSLVRQVHTSAAGVDAFAARADTPFGSVGSLLLLGGAWNAETVPAGYGGFAAVLWLLLGVAGVFGYVAWYRRDPRWPGLGIAAIAGFLIAI